MATLTVDRRSGVVVGYNIQWCENRRRHTIHLSSRTYRRKTVERFKEMVETLVYYRKNGTHVPDKAVTNWLTAAPAELQEKLAKVGLINVTKSKTCKELWDAFTKHKKPSVKPKTMMLYQWHRDKFFEWFSKNELVENVTVERCLDWKADLLTQQAVAGVAGIMKGAKAVFDWAVAIDWIRENPMKAIPIGSFINRENDRVISMGEYAKLLNICPNQEWRTIVAFARIGGLRCPSELQPMMWSDVNWTENRFVVRSPKTEHHEGHRERIVPLFPELRKVLEQHFSLDGAKDSKFVIEHIRNSNTSWNLHAPFQAIACRAGLGKIVRPFDNMRMSRSNEVERKFGSKKESLWIGHSEQVMTKHYLVLDDTDYAEAAEADLESQNPHAESHAKPTEKDDKLE